uniref:C3H1-type domain-containing protein n=1 Tax=Ananas comosus var. bracteatus TaxID=296719 RepID=A0A6V7QA60_ANACO|nr:unnamed protein product [Ananas comosus var. bracteatus]
MLLPVSDTLLRVSCHFACWNPCSMRCTTATTARSSSRTRPPPGSATSRAPPTSAPAPSGSTPSKSRRRPGSASLPLLRRPPDGTFAAAAAAAAQGVCRHFVRTGVCRYGDSCKYYHPKPEFVNPAAAAAAAAAASGELRLGVAEGVQAPNFFGNPLTGGSSFSGEMARDKMALWGHLPPSLQPPPDGGYPPLPFVDWG